MALTSLIVCADAKAVQVLSRVLQDLSIGVEHCGDSDLAATRLRDQHFDIVILDCKDEASAYEVLGGAKAHSSGKPILTIAVVETDNNVREIFARGASFVLYKPISADRVANSLRAVRGVMSHDRRRSPRLPVPASASIAYADVENAPASLMNLSQDGVAMRSQRNVPPRCKVYFEFKLPKQVSVVRLSGEVVWQDAMGRVGLRFGRVPQTSRAVLDRWLSENLGSNFEAENLADGSPSTMPVADRSQSSERRVESRHTCRLGADLYPLGGKTPQHCSLTDISSGGCYVETTEPLRSGTGVEIVVRTETLKLRVEGEVQAFHPGFGMGVKFSLKSRQQREQVKQLIACRQAAELSSESR